MAEIAVLLAVYNAEKYLEECLDSILVQSWQDWELFACNDGSSDRSLSILQEYAARDKRIHILDNSHNMGIVATRNRLLQNLPETVDFVAWVDSDDVMYPQRLEKQIAFLRNDPTIGAVGSALEIIDENSAHIGFRYYPTSSSEVRQILPRTNVIAQPALMLRREVLSATGMYTFDYPVCEDYDYWLRILEKYELANLVEPLMRYRISTTQCKQSRLKEMLRLTLKIQRDHYRRTCRKMPLSGKLYQIAGALLLLLLPAKLILRLFCAMAYTSAKGAEK